MLRHVIGRRAGCRKRRNSRSRWEINVVGKENPLRDIFVTRSVGRERKGVVLLVMDGIVLNGPVKFGTADPREFSDAPSTATEKALA